MSPDSVLEQARAAGLWLTSDGDSLHVCPAERLTPDLRALLMVHEPAVVALLQAEVRDDLADRITLQGGVVVSLRALRLAWEFEARGCSLVLDNEELRVVPSTSLTALDLDRVQRHHRDLVRLVRYDAGAFRPDLRPLNSEP